MSRTQIITFATLSTLLASGQAATLISQDFDTDPVNYTGSPFAVQVSDGTRHYALSNTPDIILNPGITGNASVYLAAQNMNNDGDGTLTYETGLPAFMNFDVDATGFSDLKLSIDLAGMPSAETENYIRALVDVDGDTFYETVVFDFRGINNTAYTDALLGPLSGEFLNFANISLPSPTDPGGILHFRLEMFNDTNSLTEATGVDNILIDGVVPEPGSALLAAVAALGLMRRRR